MGGVGGVGRRGAGRGGWDDPGVGKGLRIAAEVAAWGGLVCVLAGVAGFFVRETRVWHGSWWQIGGLVALGLAGVGASDGIERYVRRIERFLAYRTMLENPGRTSVNPGEDPSVFSLLSPLHSPVPFRDREDELARLRAWCEGEADPHPVLLLAGDGGVGKSRLALELARALGEDWTAGRLLSAHTHTVFPALRERGRPALVVVDDADICSDLDSHMHSRVRADVVPLLDAFHGRPQGGPPVRLLFVVRHAERFRAVVSEELGHRGHDARYLIDEAPWLDLAPPVLDRAALAERHAEALAAFTAVRGDAPADAGRGTAPAPACQTPLDLHAQALVTALTDGPAPRAFEDIAGVLFERELDRWRRGAASFTAPGFAALPRLSHHPELPERVMLAMLLTSHREYVAATHVVERLPGFEGLDRDRARTETYAWVRWALALHGDTRAAARMAEPWIGPERFTNWFLTTRLRAEPELFDRLQSGLNARRSEHAAALLCRSCEDFPEAGENLRRFVAASPPGHGYGALRAALTLTHPERVDPWIAEGLRKLEPEIRTTFTNSDVYGLARVTDPELLPRSFAVLAGKYQQLERAEAKKERRRKWDQRRQALRKRA
ncbi:AAA family ATPase [Streptomyces sp. NPDC020192]|uniref:AAA family ATPase n=1 Tax=Streptomyces sp. NPDC020192 TaxID=3365066 RepID=UPI0037B1EC00